VLTGHVPLPGVKLPAGVLLLQGRHQHLAVSGPGGAAAAATGTLTCACLRSHCIACITIPNLGMCVEHLICHAVDSRSVKSSLLLAPLNVKATSMAVAVPSRSLIGLKRKAGFKATDKKGVVATAGQALRAAVAAVSQFSVTVSQSLASTFRTAADTIHPSSSGAKTATHGSRSTDPASVFGSSLASSGKSSAMSGRWHAWRGPSHTGDASQARTLNAIDESAAGSTASSSYVGGSSYDVPTSTPSISDFSLSQASCGTDSSGIAGTRAGSSSNSSIAEGPSSAGSAAASQNSGPRASSRLRHATTATSVQPVAGTAASLPLRPSSAEARQPRSGAGLPLGEGLEDESEQHVGAEVPPTLAQHSRLASPAAVQVVQSPKPTTVAAAVPATVKSKKRAIAPTDATDVVLDSSLMKAHGTTGCCSCDWLKANVQSMGWKLDPWVILLSLATTLAALAAGAVQLAVRERSQEQQNALQQVSSCAFLQ